MRKVTCFVLAAVLVAAPASAQNEPVADNAVDMNAETTVPAGNDVMVANDLTAPSARARRNHRYGAPGCRTGARTEVERRISVGGDRSRRSGGAYGPATPRLISVAAWWRRRT